MEHRERFDRFLFLFGWIAVLLLLTLLGRYAFPTTPDTMFSTLTSPIYSPISPLPTPLPTSVPPPMGTITARQWLPIVGNAYRSASKPVSVFLPIISSSKGTKWNLP